LPIRTSFSRSPRDKSVDSHRLANARIGVVQPGDQVFVGHKVLRRANGDHRGPPHFRAGSLISGSTADASPTSFRIARTTAISRFAAVPSFKPA